MERLLLYLFVLTIHVYGLSQDDIQENGYVKFYYPNEQISSEGFMKDGKPDGYWITYYVTGIKKSEGKRTNHLLDSIWIFYNNRGDTTEKISYMYGKKNGYYIGYGYENLKEGAQTGIIISKELYVNDKKEGISYYYYSDGSLKSVVSYVNGKRQGLTKEYSKDGIIQGLIEYHDGYITEREIINRTDENGMKIGTWKTFYPDGKVKMQADYKNDQLSGLYKEFNEKGRMILAVRYEDGKIVEENVNEQENIEIRNEYDEYNRLIASGPFRKDVPIGIHRRYDENGNIIGSTIYDDLGHVVSEGIVDEEGKKKGNWKDYYKTGELKAEGRYEDNQRAGKWIFYYKNGRIEQTGEYVRGKTSSLWRWYYEDGSILREEEFFNGKEDGMIVEYALNGKVITKGDYIEGEKEGTWFCKTGDHIENGEYVTGLRDGKWKYFYSDSTLKFEGNFIQGNPDGWQRLYYADGSLMEERYYVMGIREKNWKKYDQEGKLVMTITYKDDIETRINGIKIELPEPRIRTIR